MNLCACKRGFFTLRDCAGSVVTLCSNCARGICAEHMTPAGICVECAARREEESVVGSPIHYRHRWYRSGGYSPIWWGTPDPYWHDTDYRWYDDPNDDDDGGGFGDS